LCRRILADHVTTCHSRFWIPLDSPGVNGAAPTKHGRIQLDELVKDTGNISEQPDRVPL